MDHGTHGLLLVVGDLVEDIVVWPNATIEPGTDTPSNIYRRRGGSAANVAACCATLGQRTRFICAVGDDATADVVIAALEGTGVSVLAQRISGASTATVVILVDQSGERTMLPDRGACTSLHNIPDTWLLDVDWLHVPAYSLVGEPLSTTMWSVLNRVGAAGGRISADASSASVLAELGVERYLAWLQVAKVDVLFANATEAQLLGVGEHPIVGVGLTVVKQGPDPVLVFAPDQLTPIEFVVPIVENVRDTTGAGDAFAAGFLSRWRNTRSVDDAVAAGISVAQQVLLRPGA